MLASRRMLSSQDPLFTRALTGVLTEIWPQRDRYEELRRGGPVAGSEAKIDDAKAVSRFALEFARQQWIMGSDYLVAWDLILKAGRLPSFAHAALLRQALEGAVTARWLMEPGIDPAERCRRGALIQRRDYQDRLQWEDATATAGIVVPGRARTARARLDELAEQLKTADVVLPPHARISLTRLFTKYVMDHPSYGWSRLPTQEFPWRFDGRGLYSALSGVAHNRHWAMAAFSAHTRMGVAAGVTGSQNVVVTGSDGIRLLFTATAVATSGTALHEMLAYCGLEQTGE